MMKFKGKGEIQQNSSGAKTAGLIGAEAAGPSNTRLSLSNVRLLRAYLNLATLSKLFLVELALALHLSSYLSQCKGYDKQAY